METEAGTGLGLEITELRLGLLGGGEKKEKKRVYSEMAEDGDISISDDGKNKTKNQVVGWPPVCSYRRKNSFSEKDNGGEKSKMYVKVSMDGAPFLRKLDLGMHKGYLDLSMAVEKLFGYFGIGKALKDAEYCEFVPIYEDTDGDWMLVGDVPWEMFIESCKRLRIMKRSEDGGYGLHSKDLLLKEKLQNKN